MKTFITLAEQQYQINTDFAYSAAITLDFSGRQPNHFSASLATSKPMTAGSFIGDTEQGGSCNVNELIINPHCNGTHTETIRHICDQSAELSLPISAIELPPLMPCQLISVTPKNAADTQDEYTPALNSDDMVITRSLLEQQLAGVSNKQVFSVAIRTIPNSKDKLSAAYNEQNQPPFFTRDAMLYLNERGVNHLLVDIPSIDRLNDDGLLTCHHIFWQVVEGTHQPSPNSLINKTITELAYFSEEMCDGFYFLSLQLPAIANDASPSRPVLYAAEQVNALEQELKEQ